ISSRPADDRSEACETRSWLSSSSPGALAAHGVAAMARGPCKCSQCDPNYYTIPLHVLFAGKVEYVCRDCQFSTLSYIVVQKHEVSSGHRRWYNFPQ
ncbi:hypothetical protein H4S02_008568, partial [Coemansia sp. RSA 2611]